MAPRTERRFTRDLMLDAVPNSSANIFATREIWSLGGMMSDIMLVPLLQREMHRLNSRLLPGTIGKVKYSEAFTKTHHVNSTRKAAAT